MLNVCNVSLICRLECGLRWYSYVLSKVGRLFGVINANLRNAHTSVIF